jgi:hypothetical protein
MPDPAKDHFKTPNLSSIGAYETRVDYPTKPRITTYGSYRMGADLTWAAWPLLKQVFTEGDPKARCTVEAPDCISLDDVHRAPHEFLRDHPVELLVLGNLQKELYDVWMKLIPGHLQAETPELILEFWEPWHITRNTDGPMAKLTMT